MTTVVKDPIAAADRKSRADVTTMGTCPLTKKDMQLVPARYAYAEAPAEDSSVAPSFPGEFRPIGIRTVRDGYLYLFHSDAPDILQEYQVTDGGAVRKKLWEGDEATQDQRDGIPDTPGIIVPRHGAVHVLYSDTQLTAKKCSMLIAWSDYRSQVMRRVSLSRFCPETGSENLLTKAALEDTLVHPGPQNEAAPASTAFPDWYWAEDIATDSPEPFAHRLSAYEDDHAYLIVDDLVGQVNDLLDAWRVADTRHNDWLEAEDARFYSASFINGLVELDDNRLSDLAAAFAEAEDDSQTAAALVRIKAATPEQKTRLKALIERQREYHLSELAVASNPRGLPTSGTARQAVNEYQAEAQSLADALGVTASQLDQYIEGVSRYQSAVANGSIIGEQGIADLVRLDEMTAYLSDAEALLVTFDHEKKAIIESLQALLPNFYLKGHLYDRQSEATYQQLLGLDNAIITVLSEYAQASGDFSFLKAFYFGEPGHQHLLAFDLNPALFTGPLSRAISTFKSILDAGDGPRNHQQWQETLAENPQLRFATLTPANSAELSHRLASLSIVARQELVSLVASANGARLHERLNQMFSQMSDGLRAHLLDNQLIYKVDLQIGNEADLARHDRLVSELTDLETQYQTKNDQQKKLERGYKKASSRNRRQSKDRYDQRIRQLRAERKQMTADIRTRSEQLTTQSPLQGDAHTGALLVGGLKSTAEGRSVAAELEQLRDIERRSGTTKMLDHARGLVHGADSMEIIKRIGGLGLVSFVGVIGAVGTMDAFKKWWNDATDGSLVEVMAGGFGTVGAAASVATVIGSARLNYYYETVSKAESVLSRMARVNVWGGTVAAWSGFFSAGADGIKQALQIVSAIREDRTFVGEALTLTGDLAILRGSGGIAMPGSRGLCHILIKRTAGVAWASVNRGMLSVAGGLFRGMNAWLWAGTVLVLMGQWVQNRFKRTAMQAWCEQSEWGNAPAEWSAVDQRYELAKVIYTPTLAVMAERNALNSRFNYFGLRIELPGTAVLQSNNLEWVVLGHQGSVWDIDTVPWINRVTVQKTEAGMVAIEAHLLPDELDAIDAVYLAVRYKPDETTKWLPDNGDAFHFHLAFGESGNTPYVSANEPRQWQAVKPLEEPISRLKALTANPLPLVNPKDNA
ncbi:toxin VasX [Marinobacter sp.]|uniref:toxin VasX n=1 Tax=Marinobacter sp. TaxID=50741 RepID=UPI001B52ADEB|nr:toxin VasX [Marinobacter sp.]MBQ0832874.1 hypothetical protein [Marinobacter sp.]